MNMVPYGAMAAVSIVLLTVIAVWGLAYLRRRKLNRVAASGDGPSLAEHLELALKIRPITAAAADCLLNYFEQFSRVPSATAEPVRRGLEHLASGRAMDEDRIMRLEDIYVAFVANLGKSDRTDDALHIGLSGYHNDHLSRTGRLKILAQTVLAGCSGAPLYECIDRELRGDDSRILMPAIKRRTACGPGAPITKAEDVLELCRLAVDTHGDLDWPYLHQGACLIALNRADEAAALLTRGAEQHAGHPELGYLLAVSLFRIQRYEEAYAAAHAVPESSTYPSARLRLAISAARIFGVDAEHMDESAFDQIPQFATNLLPSDKSDSHLGPNLIYLRGRLAALDGQLDVAAENFGTLAKDSLEPLHLYYAVLSLQLSGCWESARQLLAQIDSRSNAIGCLRVRQLLRNEGTLSLNQAAERIGFDPTDPKSAILVDKYLSLTGRPVTPGTAEEGDRSSDDERLRIRLADALQQRDAGALRQLMAALLFRTLPSIEQSFYVGVTAWLEGDSEAAYARMTACTKEAPESAGPLRLLAELAVGCEDYTKAAEFLKRVVKLDTGDNRSSVRLIQLLLELGQDDEALARLDTLGKRKLCVADIYLLGRLLVNQSLKAIEQRANDNKGRTQQRVSRLLTMASRFLKLADGEHVAWYVWLTEVLAVPTREWVPQAERFLATRPHDAGPPPSPARWIEALLLTCVNRFSDAVTGLETLATPWADNREHRTFRDLKRAACRVVKTARRPGEFERVRRALVKCVATGDRFRKSIGPLLAAVTLRSFGPDDSFDQANAKFTEGVLNDDDRALGTTILLLHRGAPEEARRQLREQLQVANKPDARLQLLDTLCALDMADDDFLRRSLTEDHSGELAAEWKWLLPAIRVRIKDAQAVAALCDAAEISAAMSPRENRLPLAGIMAVIASTVDESNRERVTQILTNIPSRALNNDGDAQLAYLRAAALLDITEHAIGVLKKCSGPGEVVREELSKIHCHYAANAIERGDYVAAAHHVAEAEARM